LPTSIPDPAPAQVNDAAPKDAFRDLHGSGLHGFAMLVMLGEPDAERVAGEALGAGAMEAASLRHPERAAAWLRARALRGMRQGFVRRSTPTEVRRLTLAELGVDASVYEALAALSIESRAALVASTIERFEPIDIETILGVGPAAALRTVADARDRYLNRMAKQPADQALTLPNHPDGELTTRVRGVAARTMPRRRKSP
jgi:DNA-directed RNA polymerase specialized sigma24 family protein